MQVRQLILTASAFVIAGAGPAHAQDSASVAGDSVLQSLVAEALARNPTVAQRQAAVRAATLRIRPAGSLPDPMLTVGVMDLVLPHFEFNQSDFTEADVELSQEIPWPGSLGARSGVMRAAAAGARAEEGTVRRELTTAMAVAYYRLGYTVTALETLRRQRALLDAAVQLSTTRYATGAAPQSDPLQAKLARDRLRSEEFSLESERMAALAAVNALRGRAPGDSVPVTSIDPAALRTGAAPQPPADSLVALALATHPRLAVRRAAVDAATRTIQVERLGARPDFTLTLRYGYRPRAFNFNFPDFFSAFVGLRLPIWAWRKQNRLADAARADSTGSAAGLRDAELQLSREVAEAAARVQASQQRLALLVDGVLPNARGTVESVLRSYQVGRAEFLTLLSVEDARYRAELEAVAVAADYQAQLVILRQLTACKKAPTPDMQGMAGMPGMPVAAADTSGVPLDRAEAARLGITFARAAERPVRSSVRAVGILKYAEPSLVYVNARVGGWVERLYADYVGKRVEQGDPLLALYSPDLVSAQEEYLLARRLKDDTLAVSARRRLALWDIPPDQIDSLETRGSVTRTLLLRAARGGEVTEKMVIEGQAVKAGDNLFQIADARVLWVDVAIFEQDAAAVRVGTPATITVDALPGRTFRGSVAFIYPQLDEKTRTLTARVTVDNVDGALRPGMYATAALATAGRRSVSVPLEAVLPTGTKDLVFVNRGDGRFVPRDVRVGLRGDSLVEIVEGLKPGDEVVASATFLLDSESNLAAAIQGLMLQMGMGLNMGGMQMPAKEGARRP